MWRVSQCCCGCSLKVGTQIILLVDGCFRSVAVISFASALETTSGSYLHFVSFMLALQLILLFITTCAFIGTMIRRPSLVVPLLIVNIFGLILVALSIAVLSVSLLWSDKIAEVILDHLSAHMSHDDFTPGERESVRQIYQNNVIRISIFMALVFCLGYYFLCVIYSYYKQMQEEAKGTVVRKIKVMHSAPKGHIYPPAYIPQPPAALYHQGHDGFSFPPQSAPNHQLSHISYPTTGHIATSSA